MTYWVGFGDDMGMGCTGLLWNFGECVALLASWIDTLRGQTLSSLDSCKWAEWARPFWRSVVVVVGKDAERSVFWYM